MKHNDNVKQCSVSGRKWTPTESAITPYLDFLMNITQLPPAKAEKVVVILSGGKLTHRGFVRGVKSAVKAGHWKMKKYLPDYTPHEEEDWVADLNKEGVLTA